jgi:hypothetical protein
MATVNITHNDPSNYSIFRNPESNAIYMDGRATVNFNIMDGDIFLYDPIIGHSMNNDTYPNVVNIYGGGWFNVREGGTVRGDISLNNWGKLSLTNQEVTELNLVNFTNSGTIRVGIFPENNKSDKIRAKTISIGQGTILEIFAAKGTYKSGNTYEILISEEPIKSSEGGKVSIKLQPGLNVAGLVSSDGKVCKIVLKKDSVFYSDHPCMEKLELEDNDEYLAGNREYISEHMYFRNIEGLDSNQINVASVLDSFLGDAAGTDMKKTIENEIINKIDPEGHKVLLTQLSAHFYSDVISNILISTAVHSDFFSRINSNDIDRIWLRPFYGDTKLVGKTRGNLMGAALGINYNLIDVLPFGLQVDLSKHSILGDYDNRATIKTLGASLEGGVAVGNFDLKLTFAFHRNNCDIARNIEKLDKKNTDSKLSSNTFNLAAEMGIKFKFANFLALRPFIGFQRIELIHDSLSENSVNEFSLEIESGRHSLAIGRFGLGFIAAGKFGPFINLEGKYLIDGKAPELSVNFIGHGDRSFKSIGTEYRTEYKKFVLAVTGGFDYELWKNIIFTTAASYQGSGSIHTVAASLGLNWKL